MGSHVARKSDFIRIVDATVRNAKWTTDVYGPLKEHAFLSSYSGSMELYLCGNDSVVEKILLLGSHPILKGDMVRAYVDCKHFEKDGILGRRAAARKLEKVEAPLALQKLGPDGPNGREILYSYQLYSDYSLRENYRLTLSE